MLFESDKVSRDPIGDGYTANCVVYFTETGKTQQRNEINHAMAGEQFLDGFLEERSAREGSTGLFRIDAGA